MSEQIRNVLVIGSGPAGLTAAIYAARANLNPLLIGGDTLRRDGFGGQLMITTDVENYPGFKDPIAGPALMQDMQAQAQRVGTQILSEDVTEVDLSGRPFQVKTKSGREFRTRTLIIATGASAKWLGLPCEAALYNKGVSACAVCDGPLFRGKEVIVVGGGDTALEEALYLSRLTGRVTVIHRRDTLRASKILQLRAFKNEKIRFLWDVVVTEILDPAAGKVTGVNVLHLRTGEEKVLPADGVFIAIGHRPNTDLFRGQLALDDLGYICVTRGSHTGIPGVFAAGDVHDTVYRQAVTAAGAGCMAALDAAHFLEAEEAAQQ